MDELKLAKRELTGELQVLRTQMKSFKMLLNQQVDQNEAHEDPMIQIGELKLLYDLHRQDLP